MVKAGDLYQPVPGEISFPGPVFVHEVMDHLPLSEVTDKFNTLREFQKLHEVTGAGEGIKVGVGDTGVDKTHLQGDLKGCVAKDFTNSRNGYYDVHGHGSHTTGHIGARGDGEGFIGLAPKCDLYHAKVLGDSGSGSTAGIAAGIRWLADEGCKLINLSLGGGYSSEIEGACKELTQQGVIIFASMGNSGTRGGGHPGTSDYTLGITALDYDKRVASFSSRDRKAVYAGYGVQVLSLVTNGRLARMSGTSMSSPDQTGVAANILSLCLKLGLTLPDTDLYNEIVKDCIEDLGSPGHDIEYGLGFIDIWKVITKLKKEQPDPPTPPDPPQPPTPGKTMGPGAVLTEDGLIIILNSGPQAILQLGNTTYKGGAYKI